MLVDTHTHLNLMIKKKFDVPLIPDEIIAAQTIIAQAHQHGIELCINVGTSKVESENSVYLSEQCPSVYAAIGIHPNDCTHQWKQDVQALKTLLSRSHHKIVAIGEIGLDKHYPGYNIHRQTDAFRSQIELALEHRLPIIIHTRDAGDQVLEVIAEYRQNGIRGIIHCFSEDTSFAQGAIELNFLLGIGGTLTYPKNDNLRTIFSTIPLKHVVLETDAPFLPIQSQRGTQNHPKYINEIAHYLATLRQETFEHIAAQTTENARTLFNV